MPASTRMKSVSLIKSVCAINTHSKSKLTSLMRVQKMNITVIDHPLIKHKLTLMRQANCSTYLFRTLTTELGRLMAYEASRDIETETYSIRG